MSRFRTAIGQSALWMPRFSRLARIGARGAVAVEFALFSPVLILMILGVYEYSRWAGVEIELEQSLRAGAQIALMQSTNAVNFCTDIDAAVQAATDLTPTPTQISCTSPPECRCPDGLPNPGGCPGDGNYASCTGGITPDIFVSFEFGTTYDPIFFSLPGIITDPRQELTIRVH